MTVADPLTEALIVACATSGDLDIAEVGLLLGALDRRGVDLGPYRKHLADLARAIRDKGVEPHAAARREALANVLHNDFGYVGDGDVFEAPENANLLDVIDRRVGLPVALGILYMHTARAAGWPAYGVLFPGHFLVQVGAEDGVAMLDPFGGGRDMDAGALYGILRRIAGPAARLEDAHLTPADDRAVLVRLLNNLKARATQLSDTTRALELLDRMIVIDPSEVSYIYEQGTILSRAGQPMAAKRKFENVAAAACKGPYADKARLALAGVKRSLN